MAKHDWSSNEHGEQQCDSYGRNGIGSLVRFFRRQWPGLFWRRQDAAFLLERAYLLFRDLLRGELLFN